MRSVEAVQLLWVIQETLFSFGCQPLEEILQGVYILLTERACFCFRWTPKGQALLSLTAFRDKLLLLTVRCTSPCSLLSNRNFQVIKFNPQANQYDLYVQYGFHGNQYLGHYVIIMVYVYMTACRPTLVNTKPKVHMIDIYVLYVRT